MRHLAMFEAMAFVLSNSTYPLFSAPIIALPMSPSSGPRNYHKLTRRSRYWPHQGERERARRLRQMERA